MSTERKGKGGQAHVNLLHETAPKESGCPLCAGGVVAHPAGKNEYKKRGKEGQARVDLLHENSVERVWVSALCWWRCCPRSW